MSTLEKTDVVIVGAGLTGLTLGFYLKKNGISFRIIEKEPKVGGVIQSHTENNFIYESGPNTGVIGNPEVAELFEDLYPDCELETADKKAKRRLIWKKGKWHALPSGPFSAVTTKLFRTRDKLKVLIEPFSSKGTNPMESVAGLVERRLGKSFLNYAIDPFISGIYAGDPKKLVTRYALPKMYALENEYGSLIKGGIKKSKLNKSNPRLAKATREVFSAKYGLSKLITALEKQISPANIVTNSNISAIEKHEDFYLTNFETDSGIQSIKSKYVITTVGSYALPELLTFINSSELDNITNLKYAKVAQVILGYKNWNGMPLNAFGGLVPSKEKRNILGVLFTSSFFKGRAPDDGCLLSVFIGGVRLPYLLELSDDEIKELVYAEIKYMLGTNNTADLIRIYRYENAIPQYEASSKERLQAIEKIEAKYPGLLLAGNIRDGIGMADRIKQGKLIAHQLSQ
jgi:oxygen-dependent protoporphyrinogen oxidase